MVQAALAAIPAVMQMITAFNQRQDANALADVKRPERSVPPAVQEMINRARILGTQTKAPGADVLENRLLSSTASGVNDINQAATSSSSALSALSNLYGNQMGGMQDLSVRNQDYTQKMQEQLLGLLPQLGAEQNKNWEWNKADPYTQAKAAESALRYGSMMNLQGGAKNLAGGITGAMDTNSLLEQLKKIQGGGNAGGNNALLEQIMKILGGSNAGQPSQTGNMFDAAGGITT